MSKTKAREGIPDLDIPTETVNDVMETSNDSEKANTLLYFSSVFTQEDTANIPVKVQSQMRFSQI